MNEQLLQSLYDLADLIARNSLIERFHFIQESGLSQSQMMSLFYLHRHQGAAIKDLANHLGISNPAVSQLIEKLVRSELVTRIDNPSDRRGKLLELTEKGKVVVSDAKYAHHQWIKTLAETIQPEEVPLIYQAIQIILEKSYSLKASQKQSSTQGEN